MSRAFSVGWRIVSLVCRLLGIYFEYAGRMAIQQNPSQTRQHQAAFPHVYVFGVVRSTFAHQHVRVLTPGVVCVLI